MLTLKGNQAVILHVAKGGLESLSPDVLPRLQAGIAVVCGLNDPAWVREGDVLHMTAELVDTLCAAGLLQRPAVQLVETLHVLKMAAELSPKHLLPSADSLLLSGLLSMLRLTRVTSDAGETLLHWKSELPEDFVKAAHALHQHRLGELCPAN